MPGPTPTLPARLFVAEGSLRLDATQLRSDFPVIALILPAGTRLGSVSGLTMGELVSRFSRKSAEALLRVLSDRGHGWLVRGAWGRLASRDSSVASHPLSEFQLSTRTRCCLINSEIHTLGQLARQTEDGLLHIYNFGRKCLAEVVDLLDQVGLRLAMTEEDLAGSVAQPYGCAVIELSLLLPIRRLQFPEVLNKQLAARGFRWVAELATLPVAEAVSIAPRIQDGLLQMGLDVGVEIPNWQMKRLVELRKFFAEELASPLSTGSQQSVQFDSRSFTALTIEDELRAMAARITSERDAPLACRYLGWDGRGGATLEAVAKEVSLTRERVRQLQERVLQKLQKPTSGPAVLTRALSFVQDAAPSLAVDIERGLQTRGRSAVEFQVEGLMSAAVACGLSVPFSLVTAGGSRFVLLPGQHDALQMADEVALGMVGERGVGMVREVAERVGLGAYPELVTAILMRNADLRWLDPEIGRAHV